MAPPLQVTQLAVIAGSPCIAAIFVALRVYARRKANIRLGADDWTVIAALILSFALIAPSFKGVIMWHYGWHIYDIPCCVIQPKLRDMYTILISTNLINIPIVPLVKVSIILLLLRASSVISWLKKIIYGILFFTVGCAVFPWILYIFVCPPSSGHIWAPRTFGGLRCLGRKQQGELLIFTTCANLFTDVLVLPIPFIIARRMMSVTVRARLSLLACFLCGLAVTGIGAAKIYLSVDERIYARVKIDWTYNVNYCMSHIENNVAIIVANIPVLRGLVTHWISAFEARSRVRQSEEQGSGSSGTKEKTSFQPSSHGKPNNLIVRKLFPGVQDRFRFSLSTRREAQLPRPPSPVAETRGSLRPKILPLNKSQTSYASASSCEKGDTIEVIKNDEK